MEETTFKKDKTPYLIFACKKCQQFMYVRTTQKTKKCLRCGRSQCVKTVLNEGEIVRGMTMAVNAVKSKQNELAIPEFRSQNDFKIETKNNQTNDLSFSRSIEKIIDESDNRFKFKNLLLELSNLYSKFPMYLIEIMAEDFEISRQDIPRLIKKFKKKGVLIPLKNEQFYYKIAQEKK